MQTILNENRSDIGSPYVYYTLEVEPSNRSATQVDVQVTIKSHLASSQSSLSSGTLTGYFEFQDDQNRSIDIKSSSESWSGTTEHTSTSTFTLQASASQTSITCKFKVDRGGGSAGTLYELETDAITIPIGHEVPSDITYTITEVNPLLVSAGISNDLIVENLSIKDFAITYTLHGGATMTSLGMYNISTPYSAPSSPFSIDLRLTTFRKNADNTKIPLRAFVKDSFVTQGLSNETLYNYITYTPISLIETSTTAKRDGQISGKVNLNVEGTYFDGTIGNVSQATYKPIIKYKFWRTDATEPSTYDYTIPSTDVTISNGTFSVTNYNIGSTIESATNYFNPDYSYRVKVKVDDNFSTYYSVEKSIPVGEATWTEYIDHVDFKAITIGGSPIIESGSNSNGNYIKYADGTMICTKGIQVSSSITNSWGDLYESTSAVSLGNWAKEFIATPAISITKTSGGGCWFELIEQVSATSCGRTYLVSAVSNNATVWLNIIGIGRWK